MRMSCPDIICIMGGSYRDSCCLSYHTTFVNDACVVRMPQILDLRDMKGPNVLYNTMQFVPTGVIQAVEC